MLDLVGVVVDQKVGQDAEPVGDDAGVLAEEADAERVECAHHQPGGGVRADQSLDAVAHLPGGLVGEGHGQDAVGADVAFVDQIGDRGG